MTENGCQTIIYRPALHCSLLIHHLKTNSAFADGFFVCEGAVSRGSTSLCSPAEDNGSRRVGISPRLLRNAFSPAAAKKGFSRESTAFAMPSTPFSLCCPVSPGILLSFFAILAYFMPFGQKGSLFLKAQLLSLVFAALLPPPFQKRVDLLVRVDQGAYGNIMVQSGNKIRDVL